MENKTQKTKSRHCAGVDEAQFRKQGNEDNYQK